MQDGWRGWAENFTIYSGYQNTEWAISGQVGQSRNKGICVLKSREESLVQQNMGGCRLVWFRALAYTAQYQI